MNEPILAPGRNCLLKAKAERAAVLIDAEAYFQALVEAFEMARESILIVGWDIDNRIALRRGETARPGPRLGDFLNALAVRKNGPRVDILAWDFAMLYALERQPLPIFNLGWSSPARLRFAMDGEHPFGASHHQKIVVVDDALGFVGGLDLTKRRFDAPGHVPHDPRRIDPGGEPYGPFHDVQLLVDGPAAAALGDIVRERWRRFKGKAPPRPEGRHAHWPASVATEYREVETGLARTEPAFKGRPEVREVEALYLDAVAASREFIYIENQYFTSVSVRKALAQSLEREEGPEICLILPGDSGGWLEENVMGAALAGALADLRRADRHGRLGVYCPVAEDGETLITVHSKLMIVDGAFLRIGSSNLNNRSMGLDTECDVALEADQGPAGEKTRRAMTTLRDRLAAEHLGVSREKFAREVAGSSLLAAIEKLRGKGRSLQVHEPVETGGNAAISPEVALSLDPEHPVEIDRLMDDFVEENGAGGNSLGAAVFVVALVCLAITALVWLPTRTGAALDASSLAAWAGGMRHSLFTPLVVAGAYLAGTILFLPITALIVTTAAAFAPVESFFYALGGCLAAAGMSYGLGSVLGRRMVRRLAGKRLNRLSKRLARRGFLSVVFVRVVPLAPFSVINLVAGASGIRFRDFFWGTLLGMAPGIAAVTLFTDRLKAAILNPGWQSVGVFLLVTAVLIVAGLILKKRLTREDAMSDDHPEDGGKE